MYTNFASGALIVIGVVIAILGLLGGNLVLLVIGLASVLAGGGLGLADRRHAG